MWEALRQSRKVSLILLSGCLAAAAIYGWFAVRDYRASRLASSLDVVSLQRAIALEPRDATSQDLLCRFLLFDRQEAGTAVPLCKRATQLNPYQSAYWLHLALAYYQTGAEQEQQGAILRAVSVDPTTPDVAWEAANFFLVQGRVPEALHQFSVVIRGDPNMVTQSLDLCWRTLRDVNAIEAILPPNPNVYLQFVKLLTAKKEWEAAHDVWSALLRLNRAFDYHQALFYVDSLLQQRQVARASEAWEQLASRSATLNRYHRADDLVTDGSFAEEILNAGFDWRYTEQPGSAVSLDTTEFHSGSQSLLISYSDTGSDSGMYEYVAVKPSTQYTISAWVKSEELQSANGPRISVSDAYDNNPHAVSQETVGTTAWHLLENSFQTGPQTELLAIHFRRDPGNTRVKGKFWIDGISLRPTTQSVQTGQ
jgi:tetratricopeptide (TPR) repeat protein